MKKKSLAAVSVFLVRVSVMVVAAALIAEMQNSFLRDLTTKMVVTQPRSRSRG